MRGKNEKCAPVFETDLITFIKSNPSHNIYSFNLVFILNVLTKCALHIMVHIVVLTHDRWYKICQAAQGSADNKLTLTIIRDTKCMSTSTTQHSFAMFVLFVM